MASHLNGLIDTNILVYATLTKGKYCKNADKFLNEVLTDGSAIFTPQIFLEYYNALIYNKFPIESIKKAVEWYYENFADRFIYPNETTFLNTIRLANKFKVKRLNKIFDLMLAQTALDNNINIIYTKNTKDFKGIKDIMGIDPIEN